MPWLSKKAFSVVLVPIITSNTIRRLSWSYKSFTAWVKLNFSDKNIAHVVRKHKAPSTLKKFSFFSFCKTKLCNESQSVGVWFTPRPARGCFPNVYILIFVVPLHTNTSRLIQIICHVQLVYDTARDILVLIDDQKQHLSSVSLTVLSSTGRTKHQDGKKLVSSFHDFFKKLENLAPYFL